MAEFDREHHEMKLVEDILTLVAKRKEFWAETYGLSEALCCEMADAAIQHVNYMCLSDWAAREGEKPPPKGW